MKKLIPLFLIAFLFAFFSSAFSYEIQITGNIPLSDNLNGIAINPTTGVAVAVSDKTKILYFIDIQHNTIIKNIPLDITPTGITFDITNNSAVVLSDNAVLQFIDPETGIIKHNSPLERGAGVCYIPTLAKGGEGGFSDNKSLIYISSENRLLTIDIHKETILKDVSLPAIVTGIAIDQTLGYLLVTMEGKNELYLYNSESLEFITTIQTDKIPSTIAVNPSTHIAVLTNKIDNSISIISLEDKSLLTTLSFYENPDAVAIDPSSNIALITHKNGIAVVKLENPVPKIDTLIPESSNAGEPGFTLSIKGSRFIRDSRAKFNLKDMNTLFEDNYNLKALVPPEELLSPMDVPVSVLNPLPGGGISNSLIFKILNPVPQVESITPDIVALAGPPVDIKVRGKNFLPNSVVNLNGENLKTRFISSILLEANADLTGIKTPSRYPVTVINPLPVSFTSNVVFLNVIEDASLISIADTKEKEALKDESLKTPGTLTGRILNTHKQPVEGVTVQIKNITAVTDSNGYFTLNNVPSGKRHLMIQGSTAKEINSRYPTIPLTINIEADRVNNMPFQIYLHEQKNRNFKQINSYEETVLKDPEIPGFEMRIPKGVKITGWDGNTNLKVSVRTVPTDRLPVKPLPDNAFVRTVYMFYFDKVGGGIPDQPIPIKSPNDLGLLPGEKAVLWYYDESPNEGEAPNDWAIAGTGTVTPDGKYIVSDPGVGIPKFCCGATAWGGSGSSGPGGGPGDCPGGCCTGAGGPNGGTGGSGGGAGGPSPNGPQATDGDPVDLATGYFIHKKTDLYVPGIIPVNISRYYRSNDSGLSAFGKSTYFEYDWWLGDYGDMLLLIKPGNYQYRFSKQPDNTYINTTDPDMHGAVATKNADNTKTMRMKDGWTYKFDLSGDMIEIADRNGNKLTLQRHSDFEGGYLKKIITLEGRTITFNQTLTETFFRTDSITDSTGRTVTYTYETDPFSAYQRLKTVTYPDSSSIQYQYDSSGKISGIVNGRGILEVSNEYDANNRVIRQTHADGGTYTFNYIVAGGYITETSMTSPNGRVTTWRFNNYGYITEKTTPDGTTIYQRAPGTNEITSIIDTLGRQITYIYSTKGRITAITDNAGNTTSYEYEDINNRVTKITDALGNITTKTYDSNGNLASITTPDNQITTFTYNAVGKPLTITDALNHTSTMEYDSSNNLIRVTDPLGNASQMAYDSIGRLITMTDAKGGNTYYTYDVMEKITEVKDALEGLTRYTYGNTGNLLTVTDAKNQIIRYEYDERNRLKKMTDQLGKVEPYSYNTSDNLVSITDRKGETTTYTYDLMNRVTRADYADGSYTTYTYDGAGRLTTITDSVSGTISYTYSDTGCGSGCSGIADKVVQEVTPLGTINYVYDAIGRRTSMTVTGQPSVNYGYDANSRLTDINTTINGVAAGFSLRYDNLGRRTGITLPNGVTTNYTYDNASRLLTLDHLNPQPLESLSYTYDANGNRISMSRPSVPLPLPQPASNTSYNDANQMLTFTDKNITYDENGNMTSVTNSCGTTTFTWNARNRLVGINGFTSTCTSFSASFKYDALGRRIQKSVTDTVNGTWTTDYLYDGLDIVQEIENGIPSVNYIRTLNIDEPLARIKADGSVRYYQTDALGSIIALTDATGVARTKYSYDPFGNVTISGEASDNPFQYTGRENDGTGLYYYRARYYSPELQRFISEDPIRFEGGDINFYVYVKNRPTMLVDPLGLAGCGPYGMSIPDPWGLSECCDKHDNDYDKCEGRKKSDDTFCKCMQNKCSKLPPQDREKCNCRASRYCSAVKGGGWISYFPSCGSFN